VTLLACLMTAAFALVGVEAALVAVGALLLLCGLALNPALTTISLLVDGHTPGPTAAEAFGWLSTGIAGGTGAASAIAGAVTQHGNTSRPAFLVAAIAAAAATATAAAARRRLGGPPRGAHAG
jgi:predicted MFS family arabinose efflux permease